MHSDDSDNILMNPELKCSAKCLQGYQIPNTVHYTFCSSKNLPDFILNSIANNKAICKRCNFIFYNDDDCDAFIKTHFIRSIYIAYKKINPEYGAMRADFFRYCVLYVLGGIYIDIKSIIHVPLFNIIKPTDTCVLDILRTNMEPWRIFAPTHEQWLLMFAPRHPYLHAVISLISKQIHAYYYPQYAYGYKLDRKGLILHITGPDAFARAIQIYLSKYPSQHRCIDYKQYFSLRDKCFEYKLMYDQNCKTHYSMVNKPLYIKFKWEDDKSRKANID